MAVYVQMVYCNRDMRPMIIGLYNKPLGIEAGLTFAIDGFDILGNLSNVQRYVNAQGRTETRYNVVPCYAMLHVLYRLNKKPKKTE